MNEALRAELIARCAADGAAVAAFLATAEDHRAAWDATQTASTDPPWPYVLLQWEPTAAAPAPVRRVLDVVDANTARLETTRLIGRRFNARYATPRTPGSPPLGGPSSALAPGGSDGRRVGPGRQGPVWIHFCCRRGATAAQLTAGGCL